MIQKDWQDYGETDLKTIPATVGVYELGDEAGSTVYIGYAGGRDTFGLRGRIRKHFSSGEASRNDQSTIRLFRFEVTPRYITRCIELLTLYKEESGDLPAANRDSQTASLRLGRFHYHPSTGRWQP